MKLSALIAALLLPLAAHAQGIDSIGGNPAPSGVAGGVLSGSYPNPGFAASPTFAGTVGTSGSTFTFQKGGVTGTLTWAPASTNKAITLPNGTTDFTATGGTSQVVKQTSAGAALTVAQLACADLSNAGTSCTVNTGTSGATIPLLNGNNTYAGTATFTSATVIMNALATDGGATDATVCVKTTDGTILKGSGTLGICLGTSSLRYKRDWRPLPSALSEVAALKPGHFFYKPGYGDGGAREQNGFLAEDAVHVVPTLVGLDASGRPNTVDILGMVPLLVSAIQEQQREIEQLQRALHRKVR